MGPPKHQRRKSLWSDFGTTKALLLGFGLANYLIWVVTLVICSTDLNPNAKKQLTLWFPLDIYAWSIGQTLYTLGILHGLADVLTRKAWESFESRQITTTDHSYLPPLEIPTLWVQDFLENPQAARVFLETNYGPHWRETPILLKGLWTVDELVATTSRRVLTPRGLLNTHDVHIPYFSDATVVGALQPDAHDSISNIVQSMMNGKPHKIGSQLLVQEHPELLSEVAPLDFLQDLFGNHFTQNNIMGTPNRTGWRSWFPGTTTVPVFIANTSPLQTPPDHNTDSDDEQTCNANSKPFTGLHCEPIANVAVQLWGSRTWTLVDPQHSFQLRPSIAKDGRSFFATQITTAELETQIPRYQITTRPGDAVWLPTWTYHKVDYVYSSSGEPMTSNDDELHQHQLSIGASLFHFRPVEYVRKNPLYAFLLIPALVKELAGIKTQ